MSKKKLALAVMLSLSLGYLAVPGIAQAETFKNFANAEQLEAKAEEFRTDEYFSSGGLEPINAASAYALGYSGAGVHVGVLDGGNVDSTNRDLINNVLRTDNLWKTSHATHVAGIIAATSNQAGGSNLHGVAYNSKIYSYGVGARQVYLDTSKFDKSIKIYNESIGFDPFDPFNPLGINKEYYIPLIRDHLKRANNGFTVNDKLVVHATGNDAILATPEEHYIDYNDLLKRNAFISVAGVNSSNATNSPFFVYDRSNLLLGSEATGIVAPGVNILSTGINNSYCYKSGTSMSAPFVTGTAALVAEAYPYLKNNQIADVLFSTANNTFPTANFYFQIADWHVSDSKLKSVNKIRLIFLNGENKGNPSTAELRNYLKIIYDKYKDAEDYHKKIVDDRDFEAFVEHYSDKKHLEIVELDKTSIFGHGLVDAGRAVQGPGAFDASRLNSTDLVAAYTENGKSYLYSVNTGKAEDNYARRPYSIWSNDISQIKVDSYNVGLKKNGEVDLILLGENTYQGPTVVNSGKLQIVREVEGDVYASGLNGKAEAVINGKAAKVYALENSSVKIEDKIKANDDFLSQALPKTTKVNVTGGLFAAGSSAGDAIINAKLDNKESVITGPIYQNQYGQINLTLKDGAKLNIKQGTGYFGHNILTGNNAINYLSLNHYGQVSLKDRGYNALAVNFLEGFDGRFLLNSDYNQGIADKVLINAGTYGEHQLGITDKSGLIDTSKGDALLVAVSPSKIDFRGLPVDSGIYAYTPEFITKDTEDDKKKWYFIGYSNNAQPYDGPIYQGEFNYLENASVTNNFYTDKNKDFYINDGEGNKRVKYVEVNEPSKSASIKGDDERLNADGYDKVVLKIKGIGARAYALDTNTEMEINISSYDSDNSKPYVYSDNYKYAGKKLTINVDGTNAERAYGYEAYNNSFVFEEGLYINLKGSPKEQDVFHNPALYLRLDNELYGDVYITSEINQDSFTTGISSYHGNLFYRTNTHFFGTVNIVAQGEGEGSYIALDEQSYDKNYLSSITIDGDLNITMPDKDVFVNKKKTTYIQGKLIVGGNINITNGDLYGHSDLCDITADNIYVKNGDISVRNLEVQNHVTCDNLWIGERYSKDGKTTANIYGSTNVSTLCLDTSLGYYGYGNFNFNIINSKEKVEVFGNSDYYKRPPMLTTRLTASEINTGDLSLNHAEVFVDKLKCKNIDFFNGDLIVNPNKSETVQIDGDITHNSRTSGSTTYHYSAYESKFYLTNPDSYFKGSMDLYGSVHNNTLELSNGAGWYIPSATSNSGKLELTLSNDGKIVIPYNSNLTLTSFAGTNGIFEFQLHQDETDKAKISSANVKLGTIDASATAKVLFTPDSQDFYVKPGQAINPFTIFTYNKVDEVKEFFQPLPFDAGAYNYTPVLSCDSNYCKVVAIQPTNISDQIIREANTNDANLDYSNSNRVVANLENCASNILQGGSNVNVVNIKNGSDNTVLGNDKNDVFRVSGNEQMIYGSAGNDVLTMKDGNRNILEGGSGNDRYSITKLAVGGEYLIDQSSAAAGDRDALNLSGFNKADFDISRNYEGDLVLAQKGEGGATIYIRGWEEHALNSITFKDGRLTGEAVTELAGEIPENEAGMIADYSSNISNDVGDSNSGNNANNANNANSVNDTLSGNGAVVSNLTQNVGKMAINNYTNYRNEYNNLRKRLGDLHLAQEDEGIWARTFHGRQESGKYGFSGSHSAMQFGYDKTVSSKKGAKWLVGAAATSYKGKSSLATGKLEDKSIGAAIYGTRMGSKGHYVDLVARHSRQSTDLTSIAAGTGTRVTGDYHNWGTSVSAEYGRRIGFKHGYYLQPEAELTYGHVNKAGYELSDGSRVEQGKLDTVTGRLGLSVGRKTANSSVNASLSYVRDFGDTAHTTIKDKYGYSYTDKHDTKDSWLELDLGGSVKVGKSTYLYGDLEKSFGGDIKTKWRYNLGVRCSF